MQGRVALAIAAAIVLLPTALSLGVLQDYYPDHTITIAPGQNHLLRITLQNEKSADIDVIIKVIGEYCSLGVDKQKLTSIPRMSANTHEYISIEIPAEETTGNVIECRYTVTPITWHNGVAVSGNSVVDGFKVLIEKPPKEGGELTGMATKVNEEPKPNYLAGLILGTILGAIAIALHRQGAVISKKAQGEHKQTTKTHHHKRSSAQKEKVPTAPPENAFRTERGNATTTGELAVIVNRMEEGELKPYMERKDFAKWVEFLTKDEEITRRVAEANNKHDLVKALLGMK